MEVDFKAAEWESFGMVWFLLITLLFPSGIVQNSDRPERTLIANGDYVSWNAAGTKTIAKWKLWHLNSGEYEAIESFARNSAVTQTFRFDPKFLPIGHSLGFSPPVSGGATQPGYPSSPVNINCSYSATELVCEGEYQGRKSRTSIVAIEPYVVFIDEGWWGDATWAFTGVIRVMEQARMKEAVVNTYVIRDKDTGGSTLELDECSKLTLMGEEEAKVLGKMQTVRRYEYREKGKIGFLLVTKDGLVAVFSPDGTTSGSARLGMDNYQEYKPFEFSGH